jgi:hypothetical protein
MERVALEDNVIPLKTPALAAGGKTVLNSIRVRKGQVRQAQGNTSSLFPSSEYAYEITPSLVLFQDDCHLVVVHQH